MKLMMQIFLVAAMLGFFAGDAAAQSTKLRALDT